MRTWAGHGAVRVLEDAEDGGASILLLERLQGDRTLMAEPDVGRAAAITPGCSPDCTHTLGPQGSVR